MFLRIFFNPLASGRMALLALALAAWPARAHEGHDDDVGASPAGAALPRFAAASDLFELVGVLDGTRLALYLDHYADNTPVQGAQVELNVGGAQLSLREVAPGEFEGTLAAPLPEGTTAMTALVSAGADSDLLAGELDVHAPHEGAPAGAGASGASTGLQGWLLRSTATLALFGALAGSISVVGRLRRKGAAQDAAQGAAQNATQGGAA